MFYRTEVELGTWNQKQIPGIDDKVNKISISDDGEWIVYNYYGVADSGIGLIKRDGTGKVLMKVSKPSDQICWLRNSPNGTEIAFYSMGSLKAVAVTLSSTTASFGAVRTLISNLSLSGEFAVNGSHAIVRGGGQNLVMYSLPNGGRDSILGNKSYIEIAPPRNCGLSLSPDGKMAMGNQGRVPCLDPYNIGVGTGLHKGFLIVPFIEVGTQGLPVDTIGAYKTDFEVLAYNKGISLNPAPAEYSKGGFMQQEFHHWNWSNQEDWTIGIQQGAANDIPHRGPWLVNWKSNEWFMLTTEGAKVVYAQNPAVYLEPQLFLFSPHRLQKIGPDSSIEIKVDVSRLSGVTSVELYNGSALINTINAAPFNYSWTGHPVGSTVQLKAVAKAGGAVLSEIVVAIVCEPKNAAPTPDSILLYPSNFTATVGQDALIDMYCFDQYKNVHKVKPADVTWTLSNPQAGSILPLWGENILMPAAVFKPLVAGTYTLSVKVNLAGGSKTVTTGVNVIDFPTGRICINLRPNKKDPEWDPTPSPAGWFDDFAEDYDLRSCGLTYGFHSSFRASQRGSNPDDCTPVGSYSSQVYCTGQLFGHIEERTGTWEIMVPNARYNVKVITSKLDKPGTKWIYAENTEMVVDEKFPGALSVVIDSGLVNVTDGRLTIKSGRTVAYPRLNAVEILKVGEVSAKDVRAAQEIAGHSIVAGNLRRSVFVQPGRVGKYDIFLMDLSGRTLVSAKKAQGTTQLALPNRLHAGVYMTRLQFADGTSVNRTMLIK